MTTETMNVHKALCELKTLGDRIRRSMCSVPFVFANKHSNAKISGVPIGSFCEEIKSEYKSTTDLLTRRDAIKRAIAMSNATTKVTIGGKEYTVAEAIEMKNHGIPAKQDFLRKLESDNSRARTEANRNNGDALESRADEYVRSLYENADMKGVSEEIKKVRSDFIAAQTTEIIDPIGIMDVMEKLRSEIDTFLVEVDSALSVSNALTELTIIY